MKPTVLRIALACSLVIAMRAAAQTAPVARVLTLSTPADSFVPILAGAGFRFIATVRSHARAPTELAYRAPFATRVRVDSIFRVPAAVGPLRGQLLTLLVPDTIAIPRGRLVVFIAAGVRFDAQIVLRAQGQAPIDSLAQAGQIAALIARGDSLLRVATVSRHAVTGDMRFLGTVLSTSNASAAESAFVRRGEHDPLWREAQVRLDAVYGRRPVTPTTVRVLFPGSRDAAFRYSPRLETGNQYVFIAKDAKQLLRDSTNSSLTKGMYFVVKPLDVLPVRDTMIVNHPAIPP
jgi:hypothetical protein